MGSVVCRQSIQHIMIFIEVHNCTQTIADMDTYDPHPALSLIEFTTRYLSPQCSVIEFFSSLVSLLFTLRSHTHIMHH